MGVFWIDFFAIQNFPSSLMYPTQNFNQSRFSCSILSKAWISPCLTFKLTPSRTETTPKLWLFQSSQLGIHFYIFHTTEVILAQM
jgi:hypothetical protein